MVALQFCSENAIVINKAYNRQCILITRHADVVNYFKHVAENSNMVIYKTYGKTNENRPLTYAVISSEERIL